MVVVVETRLPARSQFGLRNSDSVFEHKPWYLLLAFRVFLYVTTSTRKLLTLLWPKNLSMCSLIVNALIVNEPPPLQKRSAFAFFGLIACALQIIPYIKYFCIIVTVKYFFPGPASRCQCRLMGSHGCRPRAQWVLSDRGPSPVLPLLPEFMRFYG